MTDTNPRDLIERLAYELDAETGYTNHRTGERITHIDVAEARAYLAQPEPEGPTVMEIIALADEIEAEGLGQVDLVLRALTRWGRP